MKKAKKKKNIKSCLPPFYKIISCRKFYFIYFFIKLIDVFLSRYKSLIEYRFFF